MRTIMIIDDDVDLLETLEEALADPETRVITRDTTDGAVGSLLGERPDLLILDVMFPDNPAAGFDLAREIRKKPELERLPVVFLTAINQEFPGDLTSEDVGDDWFPVQELIEKPVDLNVLRGRVEALLAG